MRTLIIFLLASHCCLAQITEKTYFPTIKSIQLFKYADQLSYPVIELNSTDRMELHFDDLDGSVKNYYYTYQLCNADWTPAMLSSFDYIKGFSQIRISTYRVSSIALTKYIHYTAVLPDRNLLPRVSGNYILKVYLDGDTSKLAFTRRFMVYENIAGIAAQVQQPFNGQYFRSHQKIQFVVNTRNLNVVNAGQQINVAILQNGRWDNAITGIRPTFMTNNQIQYNTESDALFSAGKEWRWLDLRSFRLQSDRVDSAHYYKAGTEIFVKPGFTRRGQEFNFYRDHNGRYYLETLDNFNPFWQGDYATVYFSYIPPDHIPFAGKDVYVIGEFTNYGQDNMGKMTWNASKGQYETSVIMKQGYYDFTYATLNNQHGEKKYSWDETEGNYWETENDYFIFIYYRSLGGRYDQLAGMAKLNSFTERTGRF